MFGHVLESKSLVGVVQRLRGSNPDYENGMKTECINQLRAQPQQVRMRIYIYIYICIYIYIYINIYIGGTHAQAHTHPNKGFEKFK